MKKNLIFFVPVLIFAFLFSSCRPPELEGAIVEQKGGRYEKAFDLALLATQKYPDNAEAWFILGDLQGQKGLAKEMMKSFEKSLSLSKSHESQITNIKNEYFSKFYNQGVNSYNLFIQIDDKKSDKAKESAEIVINHFENSNVIKKDYTAIRLISVVYQAMEDDENSLKYLNIAAEVNPDTVQAWTDLGFFYIRSKNFEKAAESFKSGIKVSPNNVECLTMYAQCLDFAEKRDEAIVAYKDAIDKNPDEKAIPFNLGLLLYKQSNKEGIDQKSKSKYMEESAKYLSKAHELDPELKDIYDLLGVILVQLERYDDAKAVLERGIEIFPDETNIWYNLGVVYAKIGDKKKATEYFDRAEQLKN